MRVRYVVRQCFECVKCAGCVALLRACVRACVSCVRACRACKLHYTRYGTRCACSLVHVVLCRYSLVVRVFVLHCQVLGSV
jgi:hypothetical protein